MLPRARSSGTPIAVSTCEGSSEPVVQAEPLEPPPADALTHAAVPPLAPIPTAEPAVESGDVANRMEEIFPLLWLGMLTVVSVIGIYSAFTKLP